MNQPIILKSLKEIDKMRKSSKLAAKVLKELSAHVRPGVSTFFLNDLSEKLLKGTSAKPAFKGYSGFPFSLCTSVNEEVVHGMPSKKRLLKEGDIISMDFGVLLDDYYGDTAVTIPVGKVSERVSILIDVTRNSLYKGIEQAVSSNRLSDISHNVQKYVEGKGFSIVRNFVGHGIGRDLHESPQIPNYGEPGHGVRLKEGMVLAIEPMVNDGVYEVEILSDHWTAVTKDRKYSAHFEHTIAITSDGPEILSIA